MPSVKPFANLVRSPMAKKQLNVRKRAMENSSGIKPLLHVLVVRIHFPLMQTLTLPVALPTRASIFAILSAKMAVMLLAKLRVSKIFINVFFNLLKTFGGHFDRSRPFRPF